MLVLFENNQLRVTFHPADQCVGVHWTGVFTPTRELRKLLTGLADVFRARKATRWLCDHRALKIVGPEDLGWVVGAWLPSWVGKPEGTGCAMAVVQATDFFGRRSTSRFVELFTARQPHTRVRMFEDGEEAALWLRGLVKEGAFSQ